jgi:guanosine-3',5'-bis(diphosphate) 3'-pyrophosphohydrolase
MSPLSPTLLEAVAFAARAHRAQLRKDDQTPYVSHVFRVCLTVRQLFAVDDVDVLTAAVLHDTIEDTTTDRDDLVERFGPTVASWVAALSKDKRLPDDEREAAYMRTLSQSPWQVKICKLADMHDNLSDAASLTAKGRQRSLIRARQYLEALRVNLSAETREAFELVSALLSRMESGAA